MRLLRRAVDSLSIPLIAIVLGLAASGVFVIIAGAQPIDTYQRLFCEGFGPNPCATFGDLLFTQVETESGELQTMIKDATSKANA